MYSIVGGVPQQEAGTSWTLPTRVALIYSSIYSVCLDRDVAEENMETPQNFYGQGVNVLTTAPTFHP